MQIRLRLGLSPLRWPPPLKLIELSFQNPKKGESKRERVRFPASDNRLNHIRDADVSGYRISIMVEEGLR